MLRDQAGYRLRRRRSGSDWVGNSSPNQETGKIDQVSANRIGSYAEFLGGLVLATDPKGRVAERLCTGSVPSCKSSEEDLIRLQSQNIDAHLICARIWFIGLHPIGAQHMVKQSLQLRIVNSCFQHLGRQVGQKREADASIFQRAKGLRNVWPTPQPEVCVHQTGML